MVESTSNASSLPGTLAGSDAGRLLQAVIEFIEQQTALNKALLARTEPPAGIVRPGTESKYFSPTGFTLQDVVNEMLKCKAQAQRSDKYLEQLFYAFKEFNKGRSRRPIESFKVADVQQWIDSLDYAPRTVKGRLQYIRALFEFAVRRGYIERNPAKGVDMPTQEPAGYGIHSPDQIRTILAKALEHSPGTAKALAIRYFAGLRTAELERLDMQADIRLEQRRIEIRPEVSKTRSRRLITIQDNLADWLKLPHEVPGDLEKRISRVWQAAGVPWPHNVTRHSFASHHLMKFEKASKTALECGHSEQMLFAHYRELVTPEQARDYFEIRPPAGVST